MRGRSGMMVVVTPCVVADHEEGRELTRQVQEQLGLHRDGEP